MKKYIFIAAAFAALLSCSKSEQPQSETSGTGFQKGQQVTLTVKAGGPSTRVSSALNDDGEKVDFKWQEGDKIKVTVNGQSEEFILSSGAGKAEATFTGTMPAGGSTFSVQYPSGDTPDLSTQTYSGTEDLPHDKMLFTAENCSLSASKFELEAKYSALQLNLYGSKPVGSIVVTTSEVPSKTYTLDCIGEGDGTEPSKTSEPKPFFIVVPVGSYGFTVRIKDVSSGVISQKSTTSVQSFETNKFLKMPPLGYPGTDEPAVKIGDVTWAPVNCGYDATNTFGLLYQWGRKYGQAVKGTITPTDMAKSDDTAANSGKFGKYNSTDNNWFSGGVDNTLWNGSSKGTCDPCPEGWRVPTKDELSALIAHKSDWIKNTVGGVTQYGYWFNGSSDASVGTGVFLPAAGYRGYYSGNVDARHSRGLYWSSSVDDDDARYLSFDSEGAYLGTDRRAFGDSVRCVQE